MSVVRHLRKESLVSRSSLFGIACLVALSVACGGDDDHHGDDYVVIADCIDEHVEQGQPEFEATAHCLVDYPDLHPDFADQAECVEFIDEAGYPDSSEAACEFYFEETA
jgi:hypothetical protein